MIPIFWRFLLSEYLKGLLLCIAAFLAILMTMRFTDIAEIAALGASWQQIARFIFNQIPYILPIALPISCLLSSLLLAMRLSHTHELTAFRSLGISLGQMAAPLLLAAALLSAFNGWIVSEWATSAHLSSNQLRTELHTINPLLLAQSRYLTSLRGIYFRPLGKAQHGESAEDVVAAFPGTGNERIHLFLAKELRAKNDRFSGKNLTFITEQRAMDKSPLLIENISRAIIPVNEFANLLHSRVWKVRDDYLSLGLLLSRRADLKDQSHLTTKYHKTTSEIFRRVSIAAAPFFFTFMGLAFGTTISRRQSRKGVVFVLLLAATYLVCYFFGKSVGATPCISSSAYFLPLFLIFLISFFVISRTSRGIE